MRFVTLQRDKFSVLRRLRSVLGLGAQLPRPQSAKPVTEPVEDPRARATAGFGKRSRSKRR